MEKRYGITSQALEWLKSYLADRQFKVCINDKYSSVKALNYSVPQGSCSGPSYFCWYASTLSEVIPQQVNLNASADDHMVHKCFKPDIEHLEHKCTEEPERCLLDIYNWMNENSLKMNPTKMEFIKSGSNHQLKKCSSDLINIFDESYILYFINQTTRGMVRLLSCCSKSITSKRSVPLQCGTCKKLSKLHNIWTLNHVKLYFSSLVLSHLDYSHVIVAGCSDIVLKKL